MAVAGPLLPPQAIALATRMRPPHPRGVMGLELVKQRKTPAGFAVAGR